MAKGVKIGELFYDIRAGVQSLQKDLALAKSETAKFHRDIQNTFKSIGKALAIGAAIGGTIIAVKKLGESLKELAEQGDKADDIETNFKKLGGSSTEIDKANRAVLGMVDSFELMQIANKGLLRDIPGFNENFAKIAELGSRVADALNLETKEGIENVTEALIKAKPVQLANLGFTIDVEKANRDYAASLGITTKELNDNQKKTAIQVQAMSQLDKVTARLAPVTDSVANALAGLGKTWDTVVKEAGKAFNQNESLRESLRGLEETLKQFDFASFVSGLAEIAAVAVDVASAVASVIQSVIDLGSAVKESLKTPTASPADAKDQNRRANQYVEYSQGQGDTRPTEQIINEFLQLEMAGFKVGESMTAAQQSTADLMVAIATAGDAATVSTEKTGKQLDEQNAAAEKAAGAVRKYREQWDEMIRSGEENSLESQIKTAIDTLNTADFTMLKEQLGAVVEEGFMAKWQEAIKAGAVTMEQVQEQAKQESIKKQTEVQSDFDTKNKQSYDKVLGSVGDVAGAFLEIGTSVENIFGVELPGGLKDAIGAIQEIQQIFQAIQLIATAIAAIMGGTTVPGLEGIPGLDGILDGAGDFLDDINPFAKGGIVDSPKFFTSSGQMSVMGEAGPEAILPLTRINGQLGVRAQGGGSGVNLYMDLRGAQPGVGEEVRRAVQNLESRIVSKAVNATSEMMRRGGSSSRSLGG